MPEVSKKEVKDQKEKEVGVEAKATSAPRDASKQVSEAKKRKEKDSKRKNLSEHKEKEGKKTLKKKLFSSVVVVGVADAIGIVLIVVILGLLPGKASELNKVKSDQLLSSSESKVNLADLDVQANIEMSDALSALFPDELGLIDFVDEVEKLKEEGSATRFSFASQKAVRDKTKTLGVPFVIEFQGTWEEIDSDLKRLQGFPYLIRVVTFNIRRQIEDQINLIYGGFIYVDESFEKNR